MSRFKMWFFEKYDGEGTMNTLIFDSEMELDEYMDAAGDSIEIFKIQEVWGVKRDIKN